MITHECHKLNEQVMYNNICPNYKPTSNGKARTTSHKLKELPLLLLIEVAQNFKKEVNNFAVMTVTMIWLAVFMQFLHWP